MNKKMLVVGYNRTSIEECLNNDFFVDVLIDKWDYLYGDIHPILEGENRVYVEECSDATKALQAIYNQIDINKKYYGIFSNYEFTIGTSGILKDILDIPNGLDSYTSMAFRDKFLQKTLLKGTVPVSNHQMIRNLNQISFEDITLNFPIVLKPIAGAGSVNTKKIINEEQFNVVIKELKQKGVEYSSFILEEFVNGTELYIDGVVFESKIDAFTISKYFDPILNIKDNITIRTKLYNPLKYKELYNFGEKFLMDIFKKLNFKNGVFHMEVFQKSDGSFVFSECAARPGGGMMDQAFEKLYGISLKEILPKIYMNKYVPNCLRPKNLFTGFACIPYINPSTKHLPSLKEIQINIPEIEEIIYEWLPGDPLPNISESSTKRFGMFLVVSNEESKITSAINKGLEYFEKLK